jgi:hypothetical protein
MAMLLNALEVSRFIVAVARAEVWSDLHARGNFSHMNARKQPESALALGN